MARLRGFQQLADVVAGVKLIDGANEREQQEAT